MDLRTFDGKFAAFDAPSQVLRTICAVEKRHNKEICSTHCPSHRRPYRLANSGRLYGGEQQYKDPAARVR